ncbi:Glycosyl hydrolases family 2, immunoglobulin-like beta-sandwich domain protein [Candidatus Desulfosporosinus infrequens]|uniref:Glycosyl hydrolases family 2, immunoglobulin-like beta-sandwich domain protein n=1 Tax=Candidatus Desulfosporosinus infrequens TaxID=2043169 RepID=A0A2U3L164_9FIRM|nr:Glycosyl hydrolases family 2, immunoglobulin-like beta-sandwich domain protein [Candidatus Desulfosporosinus infrequens]
MFNRRLIIFIVLLALSLGALWWYWQSPQGESLQAGQGALSVARFTQNLSGSWDQFSSLRQAWTTESERAKGNNKQSFLTGGRAIALPSSEEFSVVAKRLRVPGEWSSRTMLLTFNGVQGHANVYLNGIASGQKVGEFEGSGGADELEIPAKAFRYGDDNILVVELTGSSEQRAILFGSAWPNLGRITGEIRLDAVVETTFMPPQLNVSWNETTAQVTIKTNLQHHGFSQEGPWTVNGVLSDGSAGIAEQSLTVQAQDKADPQPVTLTFSVPDARRWTLQSPFLYQLHLTVTNSRGDLDDLTLPIGLRSIALTSGKWVLNDQVIPINGDALIPQEEFRLRHAGQVESWLTSERKKGITLVYFIGQLPDELWLQAADRVGIGIWAELPVELTPSSRLPQPEVFQKIVAEKMLHPSLWAWTMGKGLDADPLTQTYFLQSALEVKPDLTFALKTTPGVLAGLTAEQSLYVQGNKIQGAWGQVTVETPLTASVRWVNEPIVAEIWALLMIFLGWMNIRSVTWRYKEIGEKRPRRRLRRAWRWDGLFVLAREGMLAGLITSGIFRIPIHFSPWFTHLLPGIELIQAQSPWCIWVTLSVLLMVVRLFQVGVVAPHLPDAPPALGLVYWLERRYRWAVFIAIGWAALPWGLPFYAPLLSYFVLVCLFLPVRIRDIHRTGGHYRSFLWVPGIMVGALSVWVSFHIADWIYLWHMLRP